MPAALAENSDDTIGAEEDHAPESEVGDLENGVDLDLCIPEVADALSTVSNPIARQRRTAEKMRIGPLAVPLGVIAWSGSLLLHGGIVAGAVLIATIITLQTPPSIAFSRGDGSAESGVRSDATGIEQTTLALPAMPRVEDTQGAKSDELAPDETPAEPTFEPSDAAPEPTLGDRPGEHEEKTLIGLAPSTGVPTMHGHARPPLFAAAADETNATSTYTDGPATPSVSPAVTVKSAAPIGRGGVASHRGKPGVANGVDSRGIVVPVYPIESQRKKEQGIVVLSVELDAAGQIVGINVVKDPGYPRLVKSAIDAVRATAFAPATEDGQAVASTTSIPFRFLLR